MQFCINVRKQLIIDKNKIDIKIIDKNDLFHTIFYINRLNVSRMS